jgi:hypothetical protein
MGEWLEALRISPGRRLSNKAGSRLKFGIFLSEGHLIHYDEWVCSPIMRIRVADPLGNGVQTDDSFEQAVLSTRMEDGLAIADEELR